MKPHILFVENDTNLVELVTYNLNSEGFEVLHVADGEDAIMLAEVKEPSLIILDWMIANLSGIEVCRRLRSMPQTAGIPIIMLTARAAEADRIHGLEAGVDDYMTKPFSPRELVARINVLLRRMRPAISDGILTYEDLVMDTASRRVMRGGHQVALRPIEFRLLRHFLQSPVKVFSREELLDAVWKRNISIGDRTVDVHVGRLRRAINCYNSPNIIRTVRSDGYALEVARAKGKLPGQRPSDGDKAKAALKLVEAGLSPTEAARQLGLGRSTVYREVAHAGLSRRGDLNLASAAGRTKRSSALSE